MAADPPNPGFDPSTVDPAEFARSVRDTPDDQLAEGMQSEYRGVVLDGIFDSMERYVNADRAKDVEGVIDWKILDRPDGGYDHYQVVVKDGACNVSREPAEHPRVTFKVKPVDFLKLASGNASGPKLFLTGGLKIEGDLMFAARVPDLFRIPDA